MAERKAFLLRLPPKLYQQLEAWAADELRSVNGQIEYLLTEAVRKKGRPLPPADEHPDEGKDHPQH